jgi:hypothetical protein
LTTSSDTTVFRHLRDNDYPATSFDTGHAAYDRFLAGAKEWQPNYRALDPLDAQTRAAMLREMPFVAPIEAEPAESLGRAMLINAYAVPKLGNGWFRHPLEASVGQGAVPSSVRTGGDDATALPHKADQVTAESSLFGLQEPPTNAQLIDCERRTLAALDGLVARIELIRRHPDLVPFEHALRNPPVDTWTRPSDDILHRWWVDARIENGVPDGVVERVAAIDFDLLDGPYLFDTEPSFTQVEFPAWRGLIWALSHIPEETAIPALRQVVEKCFATSLTPDHAGWNYARQGYRAEDLGKAAVWALEHLPRKAGMAILSNVQARAYPGDLRVFLREAIERIDGVRSIYSTVRGMG